jgi:DNA-binding beta-propeller fold protein YncE
VLVDVKSMKVRKSIGTRRGAGSIYVNVTADDKLLFVSNERLRSITVIDLSRDGAVVGDIPTGDLPIALTFSPDGKWLYTTSEAAAAEWKWPNACAPEGRGTSQAGATRPEGAVVVVEVGRARTDPARAVVSRAPAGCSAVRMAISPGGDRVYVTARNSNLVVAFDAAKLVSDPEHARIGTGAVGTAPVPVATIEGGKKLVVGNSNRFGGSNEGSTLTVLDAESMKSVETIGVGVFPREMAVSADGRTLFVTNFGSKTLQTIDLGKK